MGKQYIEGIKKRRDANKNVLSKKDMSHGTYRAKRKPNSKRVRNGMVKPWRGDED